MNDETVHFEIPRLGEPRYRSPMSLGERPGDGLIDFVDDERRLLHDLDAHRLVETVESGRRPPAVEVAGPRSQLYFRPSDVRAAIVTTGGLCPGINDVVRSVVLTLSWHYGVREIFGIRYGLRGFVADDAPPVKLAPPDVRSVHREGGTFLGSSRGCPPISDIVGWLEREAISMLFMVGGDGTMHAAMAIADEIERRGLHIAVIGIPKTIDNDILHVQRTFGFLTAVTLARQAIDSAHAEAQGAFNGVGLVRLMGRESGFIAAEAALASGEANFVLVPEVPFTLGGTDGLLSCLHRRLVSRRHAVVVVAEGAGQDLVQESGGPERDASGNVKLRDIGVFLKKSITDYFDERSVPVTVKYIDPTYMIRSAPAVASDAIYCQHLGQDAVHAAMTGRTRMLVSLIHERYVHVPMSAVTRGRKRIDTEGPIWRSVLHSTGQPARMTE